MPMGVFDFKAIANKLNCNEQKADFEEKNPKPVEAAPVVWSYEWGYGSLSPADVNAMARAYMARNSNG
jgi:hypothetical protein